MKNNKKFVICMGLLLVMLISGVSVMAHEISECGKFEVIFEDNSVFTEEEKQFIEASFSDDGNKPVPYGLKCTLFGHNYKSEITTVIRHQVYANAPRCVRELYDTKICTDCSDTQSTLLERMRIDCCQ